MFGKKWRVATHISVAVCKYQILYQADSNMTVLVYDMNVRIMASFKELERNLEAIKTVYALRDNASTPIYNPQKPTSEPSNTSNPLDKQIGETLADIIKRTNYKCLKYSAVEEQVLKYYNVQL